MPEATVKRTLVKSPPELWAEVSDAEALARHLGEFGEIRITRTEPETTVAWEGDRARGTVELEASGWGTRVTLHAETVQVIAEEQAEVVAPGVEPEPVAAVAEPEPVGEAEAEPVAQPEPAAEAEPVAVAEPEPVAPAPEPAAVVAAPEPVPAPRKVGFFARLFGRKPAPVVAESAPADTPPPPAPVVPLPAPTVPEPEPEPLPAAETVVPEPVAPEPEPATVAPDPEPAAVAVPAPETVTVEREPEVDVPAPALDAERAEQILTTVLDDLGAAHHRPFSRS